jgi:hypothetical protein
MYATKMKPETLNIQGVLFDMSFGLHIEVFIMECEERKLNVAAALAYALSWEAETNYIYIQDLIAFYARHKPTFIQYRSDLEKYLILM